MCSDAHPQLCICRSSQIFARLIADDSKVVGKINAGWPSETLVAATTKAGNHLAEQITAALNETIEEGTYAKVLDRWSLSEEGLAKSETINASNFKG